MADPCAALARHDAPHHALSGALSLPRAYCASHAFASAALLVRADGGALPGSIFCAAQLMRHWLRFSPTVDHTLGFACLRVQEFYGTCIYFFQYCFNGRYKRSPRAQVFGIVVPANGIWMAFPALGMWASAQLILDGDFSVLR